MTFGLSLIFIILTILSLRISYYLSSSNNGRIFLSPILIFTLFQILMVNIGLFITTITYQKYFFPFLIIILSTFSLNLGALFLNKTKYDYVISNNTQTKRNKLIILIGYILTCTILIYLLKDVLNGFILFINELIGGNLVGAIKSLAESRRSFSFMSGSTGIINEFKNIILVFLTIYIISSNYKWYFKVAILLITTFFLLSTGQRWPIFEAILVYLVFLSYSKNFKFDLKKIFIIGGFFYIFLFIISYFQSRYQISNNLFENLISNAQAINYRLFVSQNLTSIYIFDLIPNTMDFGMGDYIKKDFSTYLPGYQEGFATYVYKLTHFGRAGSASFSSLTLFYADFSFFAIFISFFYGLLIQFYSNSIFSKKISLHRIIFHSFVVLAISTTSLGSLSGIITHGLLSGFLMFKLLSVCLKSKKI
tara:strand:- start:10767 stop:12029 length:1263 start_codon:yes stop_codon:yes gene_type:complete